MRPTQNAERHNGVRRFYPADSTLAAARHGKRSEGAQYEAAIGRRTQEAFTLIELMVTVVVIGILAAIAYPSYVQYTVRSNRAAAQAYLMDVAQREQQYLLDVRQYADKTTIINLVPVPANVSKFYDIDVARAGPPPTFTAKATPKSGTAQQNDGTLSIDATGTKSPPDKW